MTLDSKRKSELPITGKPQAEPLTLEAEFARLVLAAFERLESAATKIALRRLTTDAKDDDLKTIHGSFQVPPSAVGELVSKLNEHNARQVRLSIGFAAPEMRLKRLQQIARRTLRRIRGIVTNVSERLAITVAKAAREGLRGKALEDAIARSLRVEREHARNIAIGQVIQINSTLTRERHQALGVTEYVWRCVPDQHTRAWHRKLNGTKCSYDSPPRGGGGGPHDHGHPGTADRCRCQAIPVIPKRVSRKAVVPGDKRSAVAIGARGLEVPQSGLRDASFEYLRKGGAASPKYPVTIAVEDDGKRYFVDGRHRTALARERGETTVQGTIIGLNENGEVKWSHTGDIPI